VIIKSNFINQGGVFHAIGSPLKKNDVLDKRRPELVYRCCAKLRERNFDLNPPSRRQIAAVLPYRHGVAETSGKLGDLQPLACGREQDARQVVGSDRLCAIQPKVESPSGKFRKAIARIQKGHFRFPTSVRLRSPVESKRVGRTHEVSVFNGKAIILLLDGARARGLPITVKVGLGSQAVVENDVPKIFRIACMPKFWRKNCSEQCKTE